MSKDEKPWAENSARYTQRLRPETIEQIRKARRVMPHEVEPLIKELLELRALHSSNEEAEAPSAAGRIYRIADLLHNEFAWSDTSQGADYWHDVYTDLYKYAESLE